MAYNKTIYIDKVTPLNSSNLNNGENGILQNSLDINVLSKTVVNVDEKIEHTKEEIDSLKLDKADKLYVDTELINKSNIGHTHTDSEILNISNYQTKTDNTLNTASKDVVGAINENRSQLEAIDSKNTEQDVRLKDIEYKNKVQDTYVRGLFNENEDGRLSIEGEV